MKQICHILRTARRNESGATLIEFAIVLPIFLLLLFSILEFSMIMFVSSSVGNAVTAAGRSGMTGSSYGYQAAQGVGARKAYIEKSVNDHLGAFAKMGTISIRNSVYDQLEVVGMDGKQVTGTAYGKGGQIVKYEVEFEWRTLSPMLSMFFGGTYPIRATALVKNEGFK